MANLQRYKYGYVEDEWGMNRHLSSIKDPNGAFVLYEDVQTLETRVEELEMALAGVRELMGEEHTYWACYPAQGPHNAVLRDYTKAWCKLIDRLIEGETFEEFTLVDEVDKYFKKEQHR